MQNGIQGDNFGMDLPQINVPERDLALERNMARFSKTKEFERLKEYIEERVAFYQNWLPNGTPPSNLPIEELGRRWAVANDVIAELNAIIKTYELASEAVNGPKPE